MIYDTLVGNGDFNYCKGKDVGRVTINNSVLFPKFQTSTRFCGGYYYDTTYIDVSKPLSFIAEGKGNIGSIGFNDNIPYPAFNGYNDIFDTLDCTKENILKINNYVGVDSITVLIIANGGGNYVNSIKNQQHELVLTPEALEQFIGAWTDYIAVIIFFSKDSYKSYKGKTYKVNAVTAYSKDGIYVKR